MTEQEKKRLEELLAEDDDEDAGTERENETAISVCSRGCEGFKHSEEDETTLRDIDRYFRNIPSNNSTMQENLILSSRLEQLIPALSSTVLSSNVSIYHSRARPSFLF